MSPLGFFRLTPFRLFKLCIFIAGVLTCSNIGSIAQFIRQPGQHPATTIAPLQQPQATAVAQAQQPADASSQSEAIVLQPKSTAVHGDLPFDTEALTLSEKPFDFRRDWWKYTIMLVAVALAGYFLTRIGTALLRFLALAFCIIFSAGSAYLFGPMLEPLIAERFPSIPADKCPPLGIAYFVIFLVAYGIAYLIVRLLRRPVEPVGKKNQVKA